MSISQCLFVLFLCLSLHACNARRLVDVDKKLEKKFYTSNKNDGKDSDKIPVPKTTSFLAKELEAARGDTDSIRSTGKGDKTNHQLLKDLKADHEKIANDGENEKSSGAVQTKSLVSVSWRVPRNKSSEKHPGFNSDYSPPKTHPPSHN